MRTRRLRIDASDMPGTYYHLFNHVAGCKTDLPFGDVEKEKMVSLILRLGAIYCIEILGYAAMGNHYHIVAYASHSLPSREEAERRWKMMYPELAPPTHAEDWDAWRARLRDISPFMKDLQQQFTCWFNRMRPGQAEKRRGTLWEGRFKSVILEGKNGNSAALSCLKYIELNPVRAKIVQDPADYHFSSWGRFCGTGHHPFAAEFETHMRGLRGHEADDWSAADTYAAMRSELARLIAAENGATSGEIFDVAEAAKKEPDVWVRVDRRVRYWTAGAVIGSKAFVQSVYARFFDPDKAARRRYGTGLDAKEGTALYSMRRPQQE